VILAPKNSAFDDSEVSVDADAPFSDD